MVEGRVIYVVFIYYNPTTNIMKEIRGRLHTPKNIEQLPVGSLEYAYDKLKIIQEHLKNYPSFAYLHPKPASCDFLFIRPEGSMNNDYIAIVKVDGIISKDKITSYMRPSPTPGHFSNVKDDPYEKAFLLSKVLFVNINAAFVTKIDGSPFKAVNDMSQARALIEDDVYQQLIRKSEEIPEPMLSDEFNLIDNEEKVRVKLEPFLKENRKNQVDSMFDNLSKISNIPNKKEVTTISYERDARLSLILKEKYDYTCQVCGTKIKLLNSLYYVESHHLQPLSDNGKDCLSNMISVCPNCHVRFHRGVIEWDFEHKVLLDKIDGISSELKVNHHL